MADQTWLQTHSLLTPGLLEDKFPLDRINQRGSYKIKGTKDPTQKRGKGNPQDKGEERDLCNTTMPMSQDLKSRQSRMDQERFSKENKMKPSKVKHKLMDFSVCSL